MTWTFWTRKATVLTIAILAVAGTAAVASVGLTRSEPVASAMLSDQWRCTKTAGILTVCTKKPG
jgi:hypothetical protein